MELRVTGDEAGGKDSMSGRDGGFTQMPSQSLKCLPSSPFLNCNCFSQALGRLVYMRLMQSHDPAVDTALLLKLEILVVGHWSLWGPIPSFWQALPGKPQGCKEMRHLAWDATKQNSCLMNGWSPSSKETHFTKVFSWCFPFRSLSGLCSLCTSSGIRGPTFTTVLMASLQPPAGMVSALYSLNNKLILPQLLK